MKILHVVPFFHSFAGGGAESYCRIIARELVRRGHEVTVVTSQVAVREPAQEEGVEVRRLPLVRFPPRPPWMLGFNGLFKDFSGFDLVNAHTPYPTVAYQALQCARKIDAPLIVTHHNDFHYVNGLVVSVANYIWMQPALAAAARIIATTKSYAETSSILHSQMLKTVILPLCYDFEKFEPGNQTPDRGYILYAGRLVWYKNIAQTIKVLEILHKEFPWLRLLLAGRGPERKSLESTVANSPVRGRVEFLGYLDEAKLVGLYQHALVTILPSLSRREAFGIALIESMACGTPVIAYAIPGVSEVVARSQGGLLARPGDIEHLAELVRSIIADPSLRIKLSRAGSNNVRDLFSSSRVVPQLLALYQSSLKSG